MADDTILRMADRAWSGERSVELLPATRFKPQPIHWLWPQWLARGKLHLLAGSPGTGKTTICVSLAAAITRGADWPGGGQPEPGDVLFWSGEDGIRDTLVPRFLAAGGDPSRLHFAGDVSESGRHRTFDPAEDLRTLIKSARELPELRMVVLDPVVASITGDSHKNSETRRGLQPVVSLAEELDVAVVGITHLSKGTLGREPLERVIGSRTSVLKSCNDSSTLRRRACRLTWNASAVLAFHAQAAAHPRYPHSTAPAWRRSPPH